jgi:cellulose synthase/poly-beta-1,6-N-acetylglucosamine synthase-like glycosyltransferase
MQTQLEAFESSSPRFSPRPIPIASRLIHVIVIGLWCALFAAAFFFKGLAAWSTGVAYVIYDTLLLLFVFWQSLPLLRSRQVPAPTPARLRLGVIVAAKNEAGVLKVTIDALLAQQMPADVIVLADDGSTDGSEGVLTRQYGFRVPAMGESATVTAGATTLVWLRLPGAGKASALNAAMLLMDTEVIVTVDADTLLDAGALAAVNHAFESEPELVAATGVLAPVCPRSVEGRVFQWFQHYEYIRNFLSRYAWMRLDSLLLISGAFASFRRSALLNVGGFDVDCLVEDYELIHRMRRYAVLAGLDWRSRVLGNAFAYTDAPANIAAFLRQRRRWFGGFLQTQFWYREMVGDRRYGWLGTLMLPVKAFDTVQPIFGLSALFLLFYYIATGRVAVLIPVGLVIGCKIGIDLAYHAYSVFAYRRWIGNKTRGRMAIAVLAAIAEPFSFQILRHLGATWGWLAFLSGANTWGKQQRRSLATRS